jgi:hypothetical protein
LRFGGALESQSLLSVSHEANPSFVEVPHTANDDLTGSRKLQGQIPRDAVQSVASTLSPEQEKPSTVTQDQSLGPFNPVARIRRQQAELLEGLKAQRDREQNNGIGSRIKSVATKQGSSVAAKGAESGMSSCNEFHDTPVLEKPSASQNLGNLRGARKKIFRLTIMTALG